MEAAVRTCVGYRCMPSACRQDAEDDEHADETSGHQHDGGGQAEDAHQDHDLQCGRDTFGAGPFFGASGQRRRQFDFGRGVGLIGVGKTPGGF